ncbi:MULTISPECIES: hypothetical protein [Phaeobacter]|uniref:hypothetical protein n=1 Tax=Phaeobacter TaxID=302485 RepID=UPI00058C9B40|nr:MULTISPECIES: hypothetical protein [Phaeobacter]KII14120.1 hypothetical protein OO25_13935 [Phaeobacter sp. S60]UTS80938.1 hypothetical protein OL67_002009 [Phaeobacter piscinae]
MQTTTLQAAAIIGGKPYPAGTNVTATPEAIEKGIQRAVKATIRQQIEARAGDALSLLGTLSDISGVLLAHVVADVVAISENPGNEAQRRRLDIMQALAGDDDVEALAKDALARLTSGDAVLTSSIKGLPAVLDEVLGRATETAKVLTAALETQPTGQEEIPNA